MSWTIAEPGQVSSVGTTRPTPLPRSGRREAQHMLGAVMAEIVVAPAAEQHAVTAEQAGVADLRASRPARRAIGRDVLGLPGAPDRHGDRDGDGGDPAGCRDVGAFDEDRRAHRRRRRTTTRRRLAADRRASRDRSNQGWPSCGLEAEPPCGPFRRPPDEGEHNGADERAPGPRGSWSRSWRRRIRRLSSSTSQARITHHRRRILDEGIGVFVCSLSTHCGPRGGLILTESSQCQLVAPGAALTWSTAPSTDGTEV